MNLFQLGVFKLASGKVSNFKIECDALTEADWNSLAYVTRKLVEPYRAVMGVPRGGLKLATLLEPYCNLNSTITLVVDDVWTTGFSYNKFVKEQGLIDHKGLIVFSRGVCPHTVLFQMPETEF